MVIQCDQLNMTDHTTPVLHLRTAQVRSQTSLVIEGTCVCCWVGYAEYQAGDLRLTCTASADQQDTSAGVEVLEAAFKSLASASFEGGLIATLTELTN